MPAELLVVDDEPKISEALRAFFEEKGFRVSTAPTIQAALRQFEHTPADVVLLDVRLPDGSGLDLLSILKNRAPHVRAIIMSCLADQQTMEEALHRGASRYLTKPFEFGQCFYAAMGIDTVDVSEVAVDADALTRVPATVARRYHVLPIRFHDETLQLAMADPFDVQRLDELAMLLGSTIEPLAILEGDLAEAIQRWYGVGASLSKCALTQATERPPQGTSLQSTQDALEEVDGVTRLVNDLVQQAYTHRATDLHLGVGQDGPWIRERIDGVLYEVPVAQTLAPLYTSVISRVKVMASLDIAEHRLPQDGRVWFALGATRLDLRLSLMPTPHGESLAIRLLEPSRLLQLEQLGMSEEQRVALKPLFAKPTGLLLVTGPTGSGKSTSLYTFLSQLNTGRVHIVTIEDPIEHELPGITQIQVQPKIGMTFATGLRSILRHDPDVIMVGEIRDQETANLAVRAALTGHLVLSTLHTNDAASGITRLIDLGIEPFLLCSTLNGILSQRLIRTLCHACRTSAAVDVKSLTLTGLPGTPASGTVPCWHAKGCKRCRETGYLGRTGVFELLLVDHHIRSLLLKRTSSVQLRQSAMARGMQTLWQAGWQHVQDGSTSLDELARVLPLDSP